MGGGGFSTEPQNPALDNHVLSQVGVPRPKVCFVPSASGDADSYVLRFFEAFTKLDCRPSYLSFVAIFNDAGQLLLTRRQDNGLWCLPGGHMDLGESIDQTAIREAQEETGLRIQLERLVGLYSAYYAPGTFGEASPARAILIALFRAKPTGGALTLNAEVTEFGWFDPDHLPEDLIPQHVQRIRDAIDGTETVVIA